MRWILPLLAQVFFFLPSSEHQKSAVVLSFKFITSAEAISFWHFTSENRNTHTQCFYMYLSQCPQTWLIDYFRFFNQTAFHQTKQTVCPLLRKENPWVCLVMRLSAVITTWCVDDYGFFMLYFLPVRIDQPSHNWLSSQEEHKALLCRTVNHFWRKIKMPVQTSYLLFICITVRDLFKIAVDTVLSSLL